MSIAGVIMVKDDLQMVMENVHYHQSLGIDYLLICDRGSSDESLSALRELEKNSSNIVVVTQHLYKIQDKSKLDMELERKKPFTWATQIFNADWVFICDSDEFMVPMSGSVNDSLNLLDADLLKIPRYNAALGLNSATQLFAEPHNLAGILDQDIIVKRIALSREAMERNPEIPWVMHEVISKFATRLKDINAVLPGFHDVNPIHSIDKQDSKNLLIYHLPFTTIERFEIKISNMRNHLAHLENKLGQNHGWHWKRWVKEITSHNALEQEYNRQLFSEEEMIRLRNDGVVKSIRKHFADIN